ncbi:hypothetical protein [Aliarcobacter butzleri]|uniref:Uncharacterized protein n=1 Tax=Aliarcobacter butzleri L352 TaxID=1447260 RepID=A0A837JDK2_9BACT|nr:hypothetical protein [Aliarcobacter butzleri]KLE05541.1 hypothetical protein AF77_04470 [Aliarcobacter butzleri L352]
MNIKTKFDPEDEVYGLHKEEIVKAKILKIEIIATFKENIFRYNIKLEGRKTPLWADESELYYSVDSLLESMKNKFIEKQI